MALQVPDTIMVDLFLSGAAKTSQTVVGGRLMASQPHTDGIFFTSIQALNISGPATPTVTRNAKGDWSLNRTAAAAETYYFRTTIQQLLRTGETYNLGDFGPSGLQTYAPSAPAKGISILDVFAVYNVGVVALTSCTIRLGQSSYPLVGGANAAIAQTDLLAATALSTALVTAGQYTTQDVAIAATQPLSFLTTDLSLYELELNVVMANTGTLQLAGLGAHVSFNYD